MELNEAIHAVLRENNRPMAAKDIASEISARKLYQRKDKTDVQEFQILARTNDYPSIFQNINGVIILVEDANWKNLLTSYWYLVNSLKGIYNIADIQFIVAVLLYYKRLIDINDGPGRSYPLEFEKELDSSIARLLDGGDSFIDMLKTIEGYGIIGPKGVFNECAILLAKLDRYKKLEVWTIIKNIHTEGFKDVDFGYIYEYFLTLESLDIYKSSVNHTPYSLRQLMVDILNPNKNGSIYDPVAGIGGLLVHTLLNQKTKTLTAKGSEINKRIAQLGNMNLLMYGIENVKIQAEDCFEQLTSERRYDYIIGDLPANGITNSLEHNILYEQHHLSAPKSGKSFGSLVLLALSRLNAEGKAVLTVSDGFLVKKGKEKEIRDILIKQDVIECVISLPHGTLKPYTDAKASLLILNKKKPNHLVNKIRFIQGKALDQNAKSLTLNSDEIIRDYNMNEASSKDSQIIEISDLRPDTNLSADVYDAEFMLGNSTLKEGTGKLLSDLVEIKSGLHPDKSDIRSDGDTPLIKVESLSKDILDLNLNTKIGDKVINSYRYDRAIISQNCILIARIGDNLKATIFKPTDKLPQILPHSNVYALIANKELPINIEYLYYQLHSSFIQEQIDKRRLGAVMPFVSISGLKEIVIPYMSLEAQTEFVDSQKASLIAEERNRVEERIKALGYKEEAKQAESDIIKTLTHQLRPTFLELDNMANRIERIVKREKLGDLKEYGQIVLDIDPEIQESMIAPDNFTLYQLLEKLSKDTKHLSAVLTNVDKVMNFKLLPEDLKEVNILDFLKKYIQQKEIEQHKDYTIALKGNSTKVMLHATSFKELVDQLLINAEKHAFTEKRTNGTNKVQFVVRYDKPREVLSIEYSNNGAPYELKQKDFTAAFEKGNKSKGSGIGGNYINRIVEAHHGKLIVEEDYKKGFLLRIELPTINNEES